MNPFALILFALFVPLVAALLLLLPAHISLLASCYLIYLQTGQEAVILAHALDPFYLLETYQRLLAHWQTHRAELDLLTYTAPLIALPAFLMLIALYGCFRFLAAMKERVEA